MESRIPIIDLFAGPGGLGEGFSALGQRIGKPYFKIGLSVEKDPFAHSTLELRSFFRQFPHGEIPEDYYRFLRQELSRDELFNRHKVEASAAKSEAWNATLGTGQDFDDELDRRIKKVLKGTDKWVLIGGPPCQAYSVIGRARRSKDTEKLEYIPENDERNYLYIEYLRIIAKHKPAIFVMENVKGMLSSKIYGERVIDHIFSDLKKPSKVFPKYGNVEYNIFSLVNNLGLDREEHTQLQPKDFVVECEKYGIPQARHRVIFIGVRADANLPLPSTLRELPAVPSNAVLMGLPRLRSGLSKEKDCPAIWKQRITEGGDCNWVIQAREMWGDDFGDQLLKVINKARTPLDNRGAEYVASETSIREDLRWWYEDSRLKGAFNHSSRSHMLYDIYRYLYASTFAKKFGNSPKLNQFPSDLLPSHVNVTTGDFDDRFRVQIGERPSTTITSHISKDGHYYIHPDPYQCRSLTVREAARLQTFPDNYFFCGNRTQQYTQVGNAVPPLLAYQIAEVVQNILDGA